MRVFCADGIALEHIGDAGNVVPTASGGGRARLAQRAGDLAFHEIDFPGKNQVKNGSERSTPAR